MHGDNLAAYYACTFSNHEGNRTQFRASRQEIDIGTPTRGLQIKQVCLVLVSSFTLISHSQIDRYYQTYLSSLKVPVQST